MSDGGALSCTRPGKKPFPALWNLLRIQQVSLLSLSYLKIFKMFMELELGKEIMIVWNIFHCICMTSYEFPHQLSRAQHNTF